MNSSLIVVHPRFDANWPWAADHFHTLWKEQGPVEFIRLQPGDTRTLGEIAAHPERITRLISLEVDATTDCLDKFSRLKEAIVTSEEQIAYLKNAGVRVYSHPNEGFWGQSVAEFALALTLCGLRRIPQLHHDILTSLQPWNFDPVGGVGSPGGRGEQFGDDPNFTNGTIAGKRIRIVGAGNVASRYASFVHMMGADVAAWDPYASEPSFHRSGTRKEWHLDRLFLDADIFVPMIPLTDQTLGLITAEHIHSLPKGCLVVMVTRGHICDMNAIRQRVLNDEISLAADVFDIEPLPLGDPFLGRHNVVHTPHIAGRTIHSNYRWAEKLAEQFLPYPNVSIQEEAVIQ